MKLNVYTLPLALSLLSSVAAEATPHKPFFPCAAYATPAEGITDFDQLYSNNNNQFVDLTGLQRADGAGLLAANVAGYNFRAFGDVSAADYGIGIEPFTGQTPLIYGYSQSGAGSTTAFEVSANDGKLFDLQSVDVTVDHNAATTPTAVQLVGYRNGNPVPGATVTITMAMASAGGQLVAFNTSSNTNFVGIDMFRISGTGLYAIGVDNINAINFRDLSVLPLKLTDFKASLEGNRALLSWKSAAGQGIKNFEVERSTNGSQFTLAGIVAAANGAGVQAYTFIDIAGVNNNKVLYYRLKQNDVAGKVVFSTVLAIYTTTVGSQLQLYPNPVQHSGTLSFVLQQSDFVQLIITDMHGRQIRTSHHQLAKGIANLALEAEMFAKGIYGIEVKGSFIHQTSRFVKE